MFAAHDDFTAGEIKHNHQAKERKQRKEVGVRTFEERILPGPCFDFRIESCYRAAQALRTRICQAHDQSDYDSRDRATSDVSGGHENAGAFVAFSDQLLRRQAQMTIAALHPAIDQPANRPTNKNWRRSGDWKINSNSEGQRWRARHFENDGNHDAQQDKSPWQL